MIDGMCVDATTFSSSIFGRMERAFVRRIEGAKIFSSSDFLAFGKIFNEKPDLVPLVQFDFFELLRLLLFHAWSVIPAEVAFFDSAGCA